MSDNKHEQLARDAFAVMVSSTLALICSVAAIWSWASSEISWPEKFWVTPWVTPKDFMVQYHSMGHLDFYVILIGTFVIVVGIIYIPWRQYIYSSTD